MPIGFQPRLRLVATLAAILIPRGALAQEAEAAVSGLNSGDVAWVLTSAAIVLTATAAFIAAFLFAPRRGAIWRGGSGTA